MCAFGSRSASRQQGRRSLASLIVCVPSAPHPLSSTLPPCHRLFNSNKKRRESAPKNGRQQSKSRRKVGRRRRLLFRSRRRSSIRLLIFIKRRRCRRIGVSRICDAQISTTKKHSKISMQTSLQSTIRFIMKTRTKIDRLRRRRQAAATFRLTKQILAHIRCKLRPQPICRHASFIGNLRRRL